jgi:hypothetical protein
MKYELWVGELWEANVVAYIKTHFDIHGMPEQIFRVTLNINDLSF